MTFFELFKSLQDQGMIPRRLHPEDAQLFPHLLRPAFYQTIAKFGESGLGMAYSDNLEIAILEHVEAVCQSSADQKEAAQRLGIGRSTLWRYRKDFAEYSNRKLAK